MFERILVLCTGNICRSPMAEALLRQRLQEKGRTAEVRSAGIGALIGHPPTDPVLALMNAKGLDVSGHRAQQINRDLLRWAEVVLVMENHQRDAVLNLDPTIRGKTFLLGKWSDEEVPDPYKRDQAAYEQALNLIERAVDAWVNKLF